MNVQRPRQVTVAGWLIILGGIAVVVSAYEQIASLHSLATRESIQSTLDQPALGGAHVGVGEIQTVLRVLAMVAAGCATASVVLGWQAMRGSRSARIVLSVLAVPLLVAGLGGGGVFSTMVAVAALLLWLPPAKQWFAGEPLEPVAPQAGGGTPGPRDASTPPSVPAAPQWPQSPQQSPQQSPPLSPPLSPPSPGQAGPWGPPPGPVPGQWGPPPGQHPAPPMLPPGGWSAWPPATPVPAPLPGHGMASRPRRRPAGVIAAAVLTWVFSALTAVAMAATMIYALTDRAGVWRAALRQNPTLRSDGITQGELVAVLCAMLALVMLWCAAAVVVSLFVWRGDLWARVTLIVLVAVALGVLLLVSLANAVFALPAVAAGVTLILLARPEARAWCAPRR